MAGIENATIIIGIAIISVAYMQYKHRFLGSLASIGVGILILWYSSQGLDTTAYGILGVVVFAFGLLSLVDYLFSPVKKKRKIV